jgi:hypothetical protein
MTVSTELDLGPIEGRHQALVATAALGLAMPRTVTWKHIAEAATRSSADVPTLVAEIKRLRKQLASP